MKTFGTIEPNDYTIEDFYVYSPFSWGMVSASNGVIITSSQYFPGAVTIQRAKNEPDVFFDYYNSEPTINEDTDIYEHVMYSSVKHIFYDRNQFFSGSRVYTNGDELIPNEFYVVSVGQNFCGEQIKVGSFSLSVDGINEVFDDEYGNLFVSESGTVNRVGNVFYKDGVAIITQDSSSNVATVNLNGIKIVSGSKITVNYKSQALRFRHEVNVKLSPRDFNFSPFNPSIFRTYQTTGSVTQSLDNKNIPSSSQGTWNLYTLMGAGEIKPYVTSIGLYNDKYELVAVAKLTTPIERTFDADQIFIVRFDT